MVHGDHVTLTRLVPELWVFLEQVRHGINLGWCFARPSVLGLGIRFGVSRCINLGWHNYEAFITASKHSLLLLTNHIK